MKKITARVLKTLNRVTLEECPYIEVYKKNGEVIRRRNWECLIANELDEILEEEKDYYLRIKDYRYDRIGRVVVGTFALEEK